MVLVLYVMVNQDLKMGKGKIAGQVGHAVETVILHMLKFQPALYNQYHFSHRRKVVLKSNEAEMKLLLKKYGYQFPSKDNKSTMLRQENGKSEGEKEGIWCVPIYDAGMTQIPANSLTVIGFGVMTKENAPEEIKEAKLL